MTVIWLCNAETGDRLTGCGSRAGVTGESGAVARATQASAPPPGRPAPRPTAFLSLFFFLFFTLPASEALPTTAAHCGNGAQWRRLCRRCSSRQAPKSEKARPSSSFNPGERHCRPRRGQWRTACAEGTAGAAGAVVHCCDELGPVESAGALLGGGGNGTHRTRRLR